MRGRDPGREELLGRIPLVHWARRDSTPMSRDGERRDDVVDSVGPAGPSQMSCFVGVAPPSQGVPGLAREPSVVSESLTPHSSRLYLGCPTRRGCADPSTRPLCPEY